MRKVEKKQLTINDLLELWNKHLQASDDEQKELWKNEIEYNKIMLRVLRNTKTTNYKVITDKLVVDNIWVDEIDFLTYGLKHYNINEFIFIDTSSQATKIIIKLLELGWKVEGVEDWALYERHNYTENKRYYEPLEGIVFRKESDK